MEWYAKEFRASYDNHAIDLTSIDMVSVKQWPNGTWKAYGWWKVWHMGEFSETVEQAFKSLIDAVKDYVESDTPAR